MRSDPTPDDRAMARGLVYDDPPSGVAAVERVAQALAQVRQEQAAQLADAEARAERAEQERDEAVEWRKSVLGAIKTSPLFQAGEWAGNKEGWGYCFELIRHWIKREADLDSLRAECDRLRGLGEAKEAVVRAAMVWWVETEPYLIHHLTAKLTKANGDLKMACAALDRERRRG